MELKPQRREDTPARLSQLSEESTRLGIEISTTIESIGLFVAGALDQGTSPLKITAEEPIEVALRMVQEIQKSRIPPESIALINKGIFALMGKIRGLVEAQVINANKMAALRRELR